MVSLLMRRLRGTQDVADVVADVIELVADPLRMNGVLFRPGPIGGSAAPEMPEAKYFVIYY